MFDWNKDDTDIFNDYFVSKMDTHGYRNPITFSKYNGIFLLVS